MTAIVMNTATGAVSEYDWTFQSMTAGRAGSDAGLFALGGDTDAGAEINAQLRTGRTGGQTALAVGNVFVAGDVGDGGLVIVEGASQSWEYPLAVRASGVSRADPGRGIRENYLGFGYRNQAGAFFRIDRIDAEVIPSKTRRKV